MAPPNDFCINATVITTLPFVDTQDTATATNDGPAFTCGAATGSPNIWYKFTPASVSCNLTAQLCDSVYDTVLQIYTGPDCSTLTPFLCNDDNCGLQSSITFVAAVGTTYWFNIGGFSGATGVAVFRLISNSGDCPGEGGSSSSSSSSSSGCGTAPCGTLIVNLTTLCGAPCGIEISGGNLYSIGRQCIRATATIIDDITGCFNASVPVLLNGQIPPITTVDGQLIIVTPQYDPQKCSVSLTSGPTCFSLMSLTQARMVGDTPKNFLNLRKVLKTAKKRYIPRYS